MLAAKAALIGARNERVRRPAGDETDPDRAAVTAAIETEHRLRGHAGTLAFRSRRPLHAAFDELSLPLISATGDNRVPWEVFTATEFDGTFPPRFPKYLKELEGKLVTLNGFMQPLRDDSALTAFLAIQYPVGCWYCEMPELPGMVLVELPQGKVKALTRGGVRVTGRLALNPSDPESFLYTLEDAAAVDSE